MKLGKYITFLPFGMGQILGPNLSDRVTAVPVGAREGPDKTFSVY